MLDLSPDKWVAIRLSLKIALVATVVALPFGIAVAWLLARRNFWGKALLDGLVHMPLVLPPVVTGYLLLISFGRRGPIGAFLADHFGIVFSFRWTGAALSCGVMGFPLLVRPIRLGIVYETDAKVEPNVKIVGAFPADSHPPIVYPVALTVNAKPEAAQYLAFLRSGAAKAVFETYGFTFLVRPTS